MIGWVNRIITVQVYTERKFPIAIDDKLLISPDQSIFLEMNDLSFSIIGDKGLCLQAEDDSLAHDGTMSQFVFSWESILSESTNDSLVW